MRHELKRKQTADTDCTKRIRVEKLNLPALRKLFETRMQEDFPEVELKPFPKMRELYETGHYLPLAIRDNSKKQELLAYALFAREKAEEGRRTGIGITAEGDMGLCRRVQSLLII